MWVHNNPRTKPLQITTMTTKNDTPEKTRLHIRNKNREAYDLEALKKAVPELEQHIKPNKYGAESVDFAKPEAVKLLNQALLSHYYGIKNWNFPDENLCPPIPGRADYLHYIADLLTQTDFGNLPEGNKITALDIGVGANCIYPLLGNAVYGWSFVGTDIDEKAIQNCKKIIEANPKLMDAISLQQQTESRFIFKNIVTPEDRFSLTICNPPFHNSQEEATKSSLRKVNNLEKNRTTTRSEAKPLLNFGGQNAELWCDGGELGFITQMIFESAKYPMQCLWFTTLVSKKENLSSLYKTLNKVNPVAVKTIDMAPGQKTSRILAWTFQSEAQQRN